MPHLTISHVTTYSYRQPVMFGEHRIMVRPRESYDQRLIAAALEITPEPASLRWLQDVFGNAVAVATFDRRATQLRFASRVALEHRPSPIEEVAVEDYARHYPFP